MADEFEAGLAKAGLPSELNEPDRAKPVILHEGSQAEADSADTPIHFEVKGALPICRFVVGDDIEADLDLRYFGAADDRTGFEDAVAWKWALDDVYVEGDDKGVPAAKLRKAAIGEAVGLGRTGQAHAVVKVRSAGDGSSAALRVELLGGLDERVTPGTAREVAETMARHLGD